MADSAPRILGAVVALIAICIGVGVLSTRDTSDEKNPSTPEAPPAADCLPVADSLTTSISEGLQSGITITNAAAVRAPDRAEVWFVATELAGAGIEPGQAIAVFATNRGNDDSLAGLIIGVGSFAEEFSDWPVGADSSFEFSITEEGVDDAKACLG